MAENCKPCFCLELGHFSGVRAGPKRPASRHALAATDPDPYAQILPQNRPTNRHSKPANIADHTIIRADCGIDLPASLLSSDSGRAITPAPWCRCTRRRALGSFLPWRVYPRFKDETIGPVDPGHSAIPRAIRAPSAVEIRQ